MIRLIGLYLIVQAWYQYEPFGNIWSQGGPLTNLNRMPFSSKEWHPQSGLSLYEFRAYDSVYQRWLTEDPIRHRGGINLYRFVGNSPLNNKDPLGLAFGDWWDPRTYSAGYARVQGQQAINEQLARAGYNSFQEFQLDNPGYGGDLTAGDLAAVQATATLAGESAEALS